MTREEAIDRLRKISEKTPIRTNGDDLVAITMAIKALSQEQISLDDINNALGASFRNGVRSAKVKQEPIDDATSRSVEWQNGYLQGVENTAKEFKAEIERFKCDDAISRKDAEQMFRNIRCHLKPQDYKSAEEFNTRDLMLLNAEQMIHALPSVTQKSGEWIKVKSGDKDFPESIVCSKCGRENSHLDFNENAEPIGKVFVTSKFCPNCGCRMLFNRSTENHELNKNLDKEEGEKHE